MKNLFLLICLSTCCLFAFTSCEKDVPDPPSQSNNNGGNGGGSGGGGNGGNGGNGGGGNGGGGGGSSSVYTLTFWSDFQGSPIEVYVSGSYQGSITSVYTSTPSCDCNGCVSIDFSSSGTVSYTASDGTYNWQGTANVSAFCNTLNLTN